MQKKAKDSKSTVLPQPAEVEVEDDAPPHGWVAYTPKPGTERPEIEAEEAKKDEPKVKTVGLWKIVLAVVLTALAVGGGFYYYIQNKDQVSYVAVCVDSRTESRITPDSVCDSPENTGYYRWWYVAEGSEVPSVGGAINPSQGSFSAPAEGSKVTFGFEDKGGVYGPP